MIERDRIAVGIDGSAGSRKATRWAAREAERLDLGLRLVHIFTEVAPMGALYTTSYPLTPVESRAFAQELLDDAADEAARILPADRIETLLLRADSRTGLVRAAADARLLVLGDEPHPVFDRLITGTVVAGVAAHSPTPVVAVPENWSDTAIRGVVVAGIKSTDSAAGLLQQAFRLAEERRARLLVVHAWDYRTPHDDMIAARIDLAAWQLRAHTELENRVARIGGDFPDVVTEVRVVHAQPAQALVDASAEADLLVVTRRAHAFPFGHLGGTGRAVLRETRCPAMVLPPIPELVEATSPTPTSEREPAPTPAG